MMRSESVQCYLTNQHIDWQFIVEKGWQGDFWERLVKDVKRCLKKTIGRASLTFDEMTMLVVEIEATLNNRSLMYMYDDSEGIDQPLIPADLIYGQRIAASLSD